MKKKVIKDKTNTTKEILNFLINTNNFKTTIVLSILLGIYGSFVLSSGIDNYFSSILNTFQFPTFNVMFFIIIFINSINMCRHFDEYDFYIIRLKTKKNHLKELIKMVTYSNIIIVFVIIFSYLALLNILKFKYLFPTEYNGYVNNVLFSIFYLCRYFILSILLGVINIIGYHQLKEQKTIILDVIFLVGFWIFPYSSYAIKSSFSIFPWYYFQNINYGSFLLEVNFSILFILLLEIAILLLYNFSDKKPFEIKKYLIRNDLNFLLKKKYKFLGFLIILPTLVLLVATLKMGVGTLNIFKMTLGLNISKDNITLIGIVMLIYTLTSYVLCAIYLFSRDLRNNLNNIFLRMSSKVWYKSKMIFVICITFLLKLLQYLLITSIIYLNGHPDIFQQEIVVIFLSDYLLTILIQQLVILIYLNINYMHKIKYLFISIIGILVLILPKNITVYNKYHLILIMINIILFIFGTMICNKNKSKIIQAIGGI